jgi:hypothetical protein
MSKLNLKIAVSTGLFGIAHPEDLATVVRKVGYGLTRGAGAIEIGGDVPHEVDYSEGHEIRYIAKKQKIDINMHGSLTVPFCIPEMVQWQEADDHIHKGLKSAVYAGAKYIDFHACLHFWLEMMSYVGARLEIIMCDWDGRFIGELLYENELLREYFIEKYWDKYDSLIMGEEIRPIYYEVEVESNRKAREMREKGLLTEENLAEKIGEIHTDLLKKRIKEELRKKLSHPEQKKREWYYLGRTRGDYIDICAFIINYLYFKQDSIWLEMVKIYKDVLKPYIDEFGSIEDPSKNMFFLRNSLERANEKGDLKFKEFYYGVIGAKFLQGHLIAACRWMAESTPKYKNRGLPSIIKNEMKMIKPPNMEKEYKELMDILKNLKIAIEMPDARDAREAGRYMLWKTKQIYVAVMQTRKALKDEGNPYWDKISMLVDFEHIATQAIDPVEELTDLVDNFPDAGRYVACVHANNPSPLHSHYPIQLGDDRIYRLLWILKEAGMGEDQLTYILFERGGFKDPFKHAVTALKIMIKFLKEDIPPDKLPPEFYGVSPRGLLAEERQWVTIFQNAMNPLKGLLKIPEEEYTALGRAATEEGKRPEEWKKEEYT